MGQIETYSAILMNTVQYIMGLSSLEGYFKIRYTVINIKTILVVEKSLEVTILPDMYLQ